MLIPNSSIPSAVSNASIFRLCGCSTAPKRLAWSSSRIFRRVERAQPQIRGCPDRGLYPSSSPTAPTTPITIGIMCRKPRLRVSKPRAAPPTRRLAISLRSCGGGEWPLAVDLGHRVAQGFVGDSHEAAVGLAQLKNKENRARDRERAHQKRNGDGCIETREQTEAEK